MKKDLFNLKRSRWLLFTLLALVMGASPAWASTTDNGDGTLTEGFDEFNAAYSSGVYTVTMPTDWAFVGTYNPYWTKGTDSGTYKTAKPSIGNSLTTNTNIYIVTPELQGDFSFWMRSYSKNYAASIAAYECIYENDELTVGSKIGEITIAKSSTVAAIAKKTISYSGSGRVALLINAAYIDDFTYTPYEETGAIDKPTAFTASDVTYNSAQLSWTAGGEETTWQLIYSTDAQVNKDSETPIDITENPYILTGLSAETTYYAFLRAKSGNDVSAWASTSFTTTEQYAKPTDLSVTKQGTNAVLSWTAGSAESAWDIVYSTNSDANPNELSATTVDATTHTLTDLTVGNTYYVWVRANYGSEGSSWINTSFTLAYTTPAPTSVDGNGISNVTFGTGTEVVNYNTSKSPYYQDNSAQVGTVIPSSETTVAITFKTGYTYGTVVWVDWNQNYEFEDSEIVFAGESTNSNPTTLNATFTVPTEQAAGNYRMRICAADSYYDSHKTMATAAGANPTPTTSYCVAQDYTLKVEVLGEGAQFAINKNSHDFGLVQSNENAEEVFTVTNNGTANLTVTFASDNAEFSVPNYVLFTDVLGWGTVNVYYWGGETSTEWPGVAMTEIGTNEYSQKQFRAIIPADATKIVFNNGNGIQTIDLAYANNTEGYYSINEQEDGKYKAGSWNNGPDWTVAAGESRDFTVKMNTATAGIKSANITLSYTAVNGTETVIPISGTVMPEGAKVVDFNTAIPTSWDNESNGWTIESGAAKCTGKKNLTTQKLDFSADEAPFFIMKVKASDSGTGDYVTVEGSTDNGSTWTAFDKKTYSYPTDFGANTGDYSTIVVSIPNTVNKLRFNGYYVLIDEIAGLKYSNNDPVMSVYTDAECTVAAASSVTAGFGFVTNTDTDPVSYYIKNDGTGTMTLSKGADPAGLTVTLDKTEVAAGEHATLTIAMPVADNGGYHGGDVVVTAEGLGTFTVKVHGVVEEEGKLNLNFATDIIPTSWTANDWMKDASGYIKTGQYGYSNTTLETTALTAEAGEKLVVVAKNGSTSSTYSFGIKYKKVDAEEWSDLIAAANIGTSWTTLVGTIAEAGDYLFQFNGYYAQIQRIYGLSKPNAPEMVVYDGESVAGATFGFGKVTDENDATHEFTVKNEGLAKLEGLAATLSGDNADHYTVAITGATGENNNEIEVGESATITVTQLKDNLGSHSATLTISATGLEGKVIALSGETIDHTILDIDFNNSSEWPDEIMEHGTSWSVYYYKSSYSEYGYARQTNSSTSSSLILTPLLISDATDKMSFKVARYNNSRDLTVRYTTDGGVTWKDYNWGTTENPVTSLKDNISSSSTNSMNSFEVTGIPEGMVAFDFYGKSIYLDDISGDYKVTSAPLMTFTTIADNISNQNLQADGVATYTLANIGNATYVGTVDLAGVTAEVTGEDVTFESNTLTIPAGKTATITVTMPHVAPYEEKTGSMAITSESWVGDINVSYTATIVDPTDFVEDFSAGKPAGWYFDSWTVASGIAHVYSGVNKPMITEKIGAEEGKNMLSFDAKVYNGEDEQTLNVYTSTDRKNWSEAQTFTVTSTEQNFSLAELTAGEYYVKFEAANVTVDNLKGVKRILPAPAHDLYEVSTTMAATGTPGASYTATVVGVSLRDSETDIKAELWFKKGEGEGATYNNIATLTGQEMALNTNKTFTLTGNLPTEEGDYTAWVTVKKASDDNVYFNTDVINFTLAHTTSMAITDFPNAAAVQADDNNQFTATFNVTVQNTGSKTLAANEVSVSLINDDLGKTTTAGAFAYLYPGDYTTADAVIAVWNWSTDTDGEWVSTTNMGSGLYIAELKEGKQSFSIVRLKPSTADNYDSSNNGLNWANKWNESVNLSISANNVFTFNNWDDKYDDKHNFTASAYTLAANETVTLPISVSGTLTNGENASFSFKAQENIGNKQYGNGLTRTVNVTAAPVIVLNETEGTIASTGQNRKVELNRSFVAGWNTICVPFDLDVTDIDANAKALKFTAYDEGTKELTFSPVTELEANKPYVIWVENAISTPFNFTGKTITSSEELGTTFNGATFQGTYAPMDAGSLDGKWGLTAGGKIAKAGANTSMKGFRAYFDGVPANARVLFLDDETTGISTITNHGIVEGIYDIQGRKVEQLRKGGLYIINGKKVVIK